MPDGHDRLPVLGYEDAYEITRDGRVFSLTRKVTVYRNGAEFQTTVPARELRRQRDRYGYLNVTLHRDNVPWPVGVHRLVCLTFHGDPPRTGMHAAHIDGVKTNNVPENLRWATIAENNEDRRKHGVHPMGERLPHSKLTPAKVRKVVELARSGMSQVEIGRRFGVSGVAISKVMLGKSWTHVTGFAPHPDILEEIDRLNSLPLPKRARAGV